VDLDQSALSRIENGERHITDIEIIALCRALGIDASRMFGGSESE
jgi:transcriptional regulator with XRE-family HTH domain